MKDLGNAKHILGIRIRRDRQNKLLFVSQEKYIEKVLERFQMTDAKPSSVPLQSQEKLSKAHYPKDKEETEKNVGYPICFSLWVTNACICCSSMQIYESTWTKPLGCSQVSKILRKNAFVMTKGT